jgi:putative phage-type endonuclease
LLTPEQKEARRKGIGGSDVSSVFGLEPYGCKLKLYHDKTGVKPDFDDVNPNMQRGIILEDIAVGFYEHKSGHTVHRTKEHFQDKVYPWMLANVDGKVTFADAVSGILEVKCPSRDSFYRMKREGISDAYILQGQHYMYVTKAEAMEYAIFCADAWDMEIVPVERDDNLINKIIEQEKAFWENVTNRVSPERLDYGDSRCKMCDWRVTCWKDEWNEVDFEFIKNSEYEELIDEPEFDMTLIEHKDNLALAKRAEALVEKTKRAIITHMGARHKVQSTVGKVSFKWEKKTYYNTKKLFKDHPNMAIDYAYENGSQSLRFYPTKEKKQ